MKVGDRVRLLHGTEEGVIVKIANDNLVEIEIEEGFTIPAIKKDVVVIHSEERKQFSERPESNQSLRQEKKVLIQDIEKGDYLGVLKEQDSYRLYFLNGTDSEILLSVMIHEKNIWQGLYSGVCKPNSFVELGKVTSGVFLNKRKFLFRQIVHEQISVSPSLPGYKETTLELNDFNIKRYVNGLDKELMIYQKNNKKTNEISAEKIKERMMEGNIRSEDPVIKNKPEGKELVVDLHIENLIGEHEEIKGEDQFLDLQIKTFEKACDNALINNHSSLKVIHGIGNGILRQKIHKILSNMKEVKYFEDSDKGKFGYGATKIYF